MCEYMCIFFLRAMVQYLLIQCLCRLYIYITTDNENGFLHVEFSGIYKAGTNQKEQLIRK